MNQALGINLGRSAGAAKATPYPARYTKVRSKGKVYICVRPSTGVPPTLLWIVVSCSMPLSDPEYLIAICYYSKGKIVHRITP